MTGSKEPGFVLQARDRHLLQELSVMRIVDREQVKTVAGFHSTSRANVRLLKLLRAGLLRRFFFGTKGAGQKALYSLSAKGAKVVGVSFRGLHRRNGELLVANFFVAHQLEINNLYCALKYGPMPSPSLKFVRWIPFHEPPLRSIPLIPDGYMEIQTPNGMLAAFIEVDLGHERRAVWKRKVQHYLQLALSGECEARFGQSRFRVLVLVPTERRLHSIQSIIAESTERIFRLSTLDAAKRDGVFAPIWFRPKGTSPETLIKPNT